jgi:hypothetical protein
MGTDRILYRKVRNVREARGSDNIRLAKGTYYMKTRGRPRKYKTNEETKKAMIQKRANRIKNMTQKERKTYYKSMCDTSQRKELLKQKRIKNAIEFLVSMGFYVKGGE